jgi:hypothetical protein
VQKEELVRSFRQSFGIILLHVLGMFQWAAQKTKARMQQKRKRQMTVVSRMTISEDKRR